MKHLKLFENYTEEDGFIKVPFDFEERMKGLEELSKRRRKVYSVVENQLKIDLFYGIKWQIRDWLEYGDKSKKSYKRYISNEIYSDNTGILKKFSGGKYYNINPEDVEEVKTILWKYIDERIPYNEVDYSYKYKLKDKLMKLLNDFMEEIIEKGLFKKRNLKNDKKV